MNESENGKTKIEATLSFLSAPNEKWLNNRTVSEFQGSDARFCDSGVRNRAFRVVTLETGRRTNVPISQLEVPVPHLEVPIPHLEVPIPHLEVPVPHLEVPVPHLEVPIPHLEVPIPHLEVPIPQSRTLIPPSRHPFHNGVRYDSLTHNVYRGLNPLCCDCSKQQGRRQQ